MNILPYIFYPLTIGLVIFTVAFFKYPRYAIAGLIIAKPIIDVSWDYNILLNINFLKIYAGLFIILGVIYIIYKKINVLQHPISLIWLIFLILNVVSIFIISDAHLLLGKVNYFLRILTGFVALILFAHLFDFEKDKKFVLSIFIIAGIFPMLLWLIPVLSGNPIISNDHLRRIIGPYHNFWHFNFYATQTLICCLAYLAITNKCEFVANASNKIRDRWNQRVYNYLKNRVSLKSILLYCMVVISVITVYKCYSKVGWITLIAIFLIWFVLQRKFIFASIFVLISVIILFVNPFARDSQKTFDNEIAYFLHNTSNKETVFRGRLKTLENILDRQRTLPVKNQLFGAKTSIDYSGSDFSMILWNNGFSGIILYAVLLSLAGYLLIRKYARKEVPIVLASILVFVIYVLSSFGTHPLLIPNFQWFMWGMVGFVLAKHEIAVGSLDQKSSCPILRLYQGLGRKGTNARQ